MESFLIAAVYKFVALPDFEDIRGDLLEICRKNQVTGTLLLASEGINGTIAGPEKGVHGVLGFLREDSRFRDMEAKFSSSNVSPFNRMKVRLKKEIVTMGVPGVDPKKVVGSYVDPSDWNHLLGNPDVLVVDTRNDYEVEMGTFRGASNPDIQSFSEFPDWIRREVERRKPSKVAMFCTGGIRCEKSTSFLKDEGFEEVFHLKGGILKYLETIPAEESLWEGECFVFDQRVSVTHGLKEGSYDLCHACRNPIGEVHKKSSMYVDGVSCPRCFDVSTPEKKASFAERQKQIRLARNRGTQHIKDESSRSLE